METSVPSLRVIVKLEMWVLALHKDTAVVMQSHFLGLKEVTYLCVDPPNADWREEPVSKKTETATLRLWLPAQDKQN